MNKELVPDLEICQEAKAKGVVIESSFWYKIGDSTGTVNIILKEKLDIGNIHFSYYPAPLTDEILKKLKDVEIEIVCGIDNVFIVRWLNDSFIDKKLSNALLLLAIKLKDEGII